MMSIRRRLEKLERDAGITSKPVPIPYRSRTPRKLATLCRVILGGPGSGMPDADLDRRAERLAQLLIELTGNTGIEPQQ